MARRIINPVSEKRRELSINCKEMTKDELFDMEECANFLEVNNRLSKHNPETLPGGPMNVLLKKAEHKIVLDMGVDVRKFYIKQLLRKYLHKKGLKDWIHIKIDTESGEYGLHYYNLNDE
ncbi:large subunit ribosomal protein L22e [Nematocida minor]|uniref:large subunit ribosomal protein L22e n=1 Tax=Nematocida minor TaxID=1912983 RepID=UPI002220C6BF|nr:large subunit ribosomal protein L22e [Nematocida minor]KAI5189712.1 large subunit ribosomal protein L22e [Nematocida minor]